MIVIDASILLEILLRRPVAEDIEATIGTSTMGAPHLIDLEVLNTLRHFERKGSLQRNEVPDRVDDLRSLGLVRFAHEPLLTRVVQLRHNLTSYDAVYLALAEALNAPLLTRDRAFLSVPKRQAEVILI